MVIQFFEVFERQRQINERVERFKATKQQIASNYKSIISPF